MIFLTSGRKKQITNSYGNLFSRSNENHPKFGTNKATYGIAVRTQHYCDTNKPTYGSEVRRQYSVLFLSHKYKRYPL